RGAADREVEEADRLRPRDLAVLPERPRERGHARVDLLREDVGVEPLAAEMALDDERFVADGIAVGERGQELMDLLLHAVARSRTPARSVRYFPRTTGQA